MEKPSKEALIEASVALEEHARHLRNEAEQDETEDHNEASAKRQAAEWCDQVAYYLEAIRLEPPQYERIKDKATLLKMLRDADTEEGSVDCGEAFLGGEAYE